MFALCIPNGSTERASRFETTPRKACVTRLLQRSSFQLSTFDSQLLSNHTLINSASVNSSDSRTYKEPRMCIKTMGFKPRRITHFPMASSQTLWNHTLPKNRRWRAFSASPGPVGRGGGYQFLALGRGAQDTGSQATYHESPTLRQSMGVESRKTLTHNRDSKVLKGGVR